MNKEPLELRLGEPAPGLAEDLQLFLQAAPLTELVLNVNLQHRHLLIWIWSRCSFVGDNIQYRY